jgi:hypothetical protein
MKRSLMTVALLLLAFAGMGIVENSAVRSKPPEPADNVSAIYKLTGEFRTVFANLLWIKADRYHHEYIQHDSNWCNDKELLGMFKLITALDPKFVEAYSTGAYVLMYGYHSYPKALIYLRKGLDANPKSSELNELVAMIYGQRLKNPRAALPYARRAVAFAPDDFSRGVARRTLHTLERMIREGS